MKASKTSRLLIRSIENRVIWGGGDLNAAIQEAIAAVFPHASDERQSDLYATLSEQWDANPSGVSRRLFVKEAVQNWEHRHLYG